MARNKANPDVFIHWTTGGLKEFMVRAAPLHAISSRAVRRQLQSSTAALSRSSTLIMLKRSNTPIYGKNVVIVWRGSGTRPSGRVQESSTRCWSAFSRISKAGRTTEYREFS
jgi:hypothetical protein